MMNGDATTFGARLRSHRERRCVSLDTIAEHTKIKVSLLEALERDDVSRWPGGIFRRAFIRAYAQAIGLDPDPVVREFLDCYPDPDEQAATETAANGAAPDARGGRGAWLRAALGATIKSLGRNTAERTANLPEREPAPERAVAPQPHTPAEWVANPPEREALAERLPDSLEREASAERVPSPPEREASAERLHDSPEREASAERDLNSQEREASAERSSFPDLDALADLCTALACVGAPEELTPLLERTAAIVDASGIVLWLWDADASALRATLAYGYSDAVLAQLPTVEHDADNATAAALRLRDTCIVAGSERANGALAVPLLTASGCGGVLGLELRGGGERNAAVRAAVAIVAAQLAAMLHVPAAAAGRKLA